MGAGRQRCPRHTVVLALEGAGAVDDQPRGQLTEQIREARICKIQHDASHVVRSLRCACRAPGDEQLDPGICPERAHDPAAEVARAAEHHDPQRRSCGHDLKGALSGVKLTGAFGRVSTPRLKISGRL